MHFETIASGLKFPEGPVWMLDGSVICTEIANGRISRIQPDGLRETVATPGGGPNGAAIGPDGALYVCNNGGMLCDEQADGRLFSNGLATPDYTTGRIERIDLKTGAVTRLYESCDGRRLSAPNDIVFDTSGGFWFSDLGKPLTPDNQESGGIFYAAPDGSFVKRVVDDLSCVNGIGLSPDERTLYVALTLERVILAFEITGKGEVAPGAPRGRLVKTFPEGQMLDSLAVTADGHVCVATLNVGGIADVAPATGETVFHPCPDQSTTNICFGGAAMQDAWITQSSTGQLIKTRWDQPGHRLAFYA